MVGFSKSVGEPEGNVVIKWGEVVSVEDNTGNGKITVKVGTKAELITPVPLLPKMFQSVPKVGEMVFVIDGRTGRDYDNTYYVGPVVSQMQFMGKCPYRNATSELKGSVVPNEADISMNSQTFGAFPDKNDIALIGRKGEDVILKEGEIDIRCGIRIPLEDEWRGVNGFVKFNRECPSFIQLKETPSWYKDKNYGFERFKSVANIVADKINLFSNSTLNEVRKQDNTKNYDLVSDEDLPAIMSDKLHPAVNGDELVYLLKLMVSCFFSHFHHWFGPKEGAPNSRQGGIDIQEMLELKSFDINRILSRDVRIS